MLPVMPVEKIASSRPMTSSRTMVGTSSNMARSSPCFNGCALIVISSTTNSVCHSAVRSLSTVNASKTSAAVSSDMPTNWPPSDLTA